MKYNSNWSDQQAKTIREYRAENFTYSDLVKLFGGTESTIADLCKGVTYKHAGGPICGVDYPRHQHGRSLL